MDMLTIGLPGFWSREGPWKHLVSVIQEAWSVTAEQLKGKWPGCDLSQEYLQFAISASNRSKAP